MEGECFNEFGVFSWVVEEEEEEEPEGVEEEGESAEGDIVGSEERFTKNELCPLSFLVVLSSSALPDFAFLSGAFCCTLPEDSMYHLSTFSPRSASESATYTSPKNLFPLTTS
jgi:hypothetical protein